VTLFILSPNQHCVAFVRGWRNTNGVGKHTRGFSPV